MNNHNDLPHIMDQNRNSEDSKFIKSNYDEADIRRSQES